MADVLPAATKTEEGHRASELLDAKLTATPPVAAGPFRLTVPTAIFPPATVEGATTSPDTETGVIAKLAVAVVDPSVAVIVALTAVDTASVVTSNVAVVPPAGTVSLPGGTAVLALEDRLIVTPPVGAGVDNVIVPVEDTPPTTDAGDRERFANSPGTTVKMAVAESSLALAVMVTAVDAATAAVVIEKLADVAPAGTVTVTGGTAVAELDDK